jgi:hypothetical protein
MAKFDTDRMKKDLSVVCENVSQKVHDVAPESWVWFIKSYRGVPTAYFCVGSVDVPGPEYLPVVDGVAAADKVGRIGDSEAQWETKIRELDSTITALSRVLEESGLERKTRRLIPNGSRNQPPTQKDVFIGYALPTESYKLATK